MKNKIVGDYLDELFLNPRCELDYTKDYELLIAVLLSAQTTDVRVNSVTPELFAKYPSLEALAEADLADLERIIRPIGTYSRKAKFLKEMASKLKEIGYVPEDRKYLESLPGVGRKTTNVVLSNLYNYPAIAVDTHVARVSKRLAIAKEKDDVLVIEKKLEKFFPKEEWAKRHHQLVLFGRYHCKAIKPQCEICKLQSICKYYKKCYTKFK